MNRIILVFVYLFSLTTSFAQLTLTLQVPQTGVLLKPQLWNGIITNSYPESKQVYVGLTLSDVLSGEPVMSATTTQFDVATGVLQVIESNIAPISYDYLVSAITDRNPEGYLPAGTYNACYTIFLVSEGVGTPLTEECTPIVIEPVSPPILNIPFDEQVIHNAYPQFSWIPPMPLEIFSDLNYDFILVEVANAQSAADAIQQNLPVYTTNTRDMFLNYPASYSQLDTGKVYAWQITAKNNDQFAAKSEIWTFTLSNSSVQSNVQSFNGYTKLKRTLDASIAAVSDNLLAYYENDAEDSIIQYNIYDIDENGDALKPVTTGQLNLTSGINLVSIPLQRTTAIANNKQYLFQIRNSRLETWSMKFICYKND